MFFRCRSRALPPEIGPIAADERLAGGIAAQAALGRVSHYRGVSLRWYRLSRHNGPLRILFCREIERSKMWLDFFKEFCLPPGALLQYPCARTQEFRTDLSQFFT